MKNIILGLFCLVSFSHCSTPSAKVEEKSKTQEEKVAQKGPGKISGRVSFPGESIPEDLTIIVRDMASGKIYSSRDWNRQTFAYIMEVDAPATYEVFAMSQEKMPGFKAYYSEFITCGMYENCKSHQPIPVSVSPGQIANGINPGDWYVK